jgi:NAD(P)-dependent dehydrogenase (short-subunit alcohol dehydrogenase family)
MQIDGSTILISGGSSGLGNACAQRFLRMGAKVILMDIAAPEEAMLAAASGNCIYMRADVTNEAEVGFAISEGVRHFGPLAAAVICAGVLHTERSLGRDGPASLDAFRRVIEINLIGTFNVLRLSAEAIAKRDVEDPENERGVIVMTSSIAAFDGQIGQSAYAASKGGVASMTLPIARDLGRVGIRVVSIAPGVFETPMMEIAPVKVRQSLLDETAFPKRFGEPDEFASAVQHVIENPMFNGCTLRLDAGLRMPAK